MDIHDNARTTRHSRMLMVRRLAGGWTAAVVAAAQGVCPKTVRKWRDRYVAGGEADLADRSSRPPLLERPLPTMQRCDFRGRTGRAEGYLLLLDACGRSTSDHVLSYREEQPPDHLGETPITSSVGSAPRSAYR
jgi:leucine-zipper of insertion element IS481